MDPAIPTPAQIRRLPVTGVREFCKGLRKAGLLIGHGGSHLRVTTRSGVFVATVPCTPSDHRALMNGRSQLVKRVAAMRAQRSDLGDVNPE